MTERLLTPSKITAWLDCAHFLTLSHQVDSGALTVTPLRVRLIGLASGGQRAVSTRRTAWPSTGSRGLDVLEVPGRDRGESFSRLGGPDRESAGLRSTT